MEEVCRLVQQDIAQVILKPTTWVLIGSAALVEGDTAAAKVPRAPVAGQRLRQRLLVLGVNNGHALLVDARWLATEHLHEMRIGQFQQGQVMVGFFRWEVGLESVMLADVPGEAFSVLKPIAGKCRRDPIAKVADQRCSGPSTFDR